jgi:hypothetical protein
MSNVPGEDLEGQRDRKVHTEVIPPGSLDATKFVFDEDKKVSQAATEAAKELGIRVSSPGFKNAEQVELNSDQTLKQAGVNDGYVLYLIDTAGGQ